MLKMRTFQFFFVLSIVLLTNGQVDQTLIPRTSGVDVVFGVNMKIRLANIFPDDSRFLLRMAYVETRFGDDPKTYNSSTSGGIWQVSERIFNATKTLNTTIIRAYREKVLQTFNITWENTTWADLEKPMYSGLAIKLFLTTLPKIPDTITIQANFWRQHINLIGLTAKFIADVRELEEVSACEGKMDLVIVLDGSGSVGVNNFVTAKNFVVNLTSTFDKTAVQIGFIVYSSSSTTIFPLNNTLNDTQMAAAIRNAFYPGLGTATHLAINAATAMLHRNDSNSIVPRIITVFTDGQSDSPSETAKSANNSQIEGIVSFAVGIGSGPNEQELLVIAGNDSSRVISSSSFDALTELSYRMNEETCTVPQTPPTNGSVSDTVKQNETRYFEYQVPLVGITVRINVTSGQASGYYSFSFPTPSIAINDGVINGATFIPGRTTANNYPDVYQESKQGNSSRLFIAVKGTGDKNDFDMETSQGDSTPTDGGSSTPTDGGSSTPTDGGSSTPTDSGASQTQYLCFSLLFLLLGAHFFSSMA